MLASLERYCPNREEGCEWTGKSDQVKGHYKICTMKKPKGSIAREIEEKDILIALLKGKISASNQKCAQIEEENERLKDENEKLLKKIQVYDAFFNHNNGKNAPDVEGRAYALSSSHQSRAGEEEADEKVGKSLSVPRNRSNNSSSDASNLAKLRNYEKKSVYL